MATETTNFGFTYPVQKDNPLEQKVFLDEIDTTLFGIAPPGSVALADPGGNGIVVRTSLGVTVNRTLTQPAAGLTIADPTGVAGNPTFVLANDLAALEALTGTGFASRTGVDAWALRTPAQVLSDIGAQAAGSYQPLDADLTAIAALAGTSGLLKKTAADTWSLDTATYATQAYADALVVGLLDDRGNYDASVNTFPASGGSGAAGAILKGDLWTISVAGTLGGHPVTAGDVVRALADTPGQTDANWAIGENNFGYVALNQALADGKIYIGNGSGIGTAVTPSGDVTISNAGVTAIGANKVTLAMINSSPLLNGVLPRSNGTNFVASQITDNGALIELPGAVSFPGSAQFDNSIVAAGGITLSAPALPESAGGTTLGLASLPFSSMFIGNAANNSSQITGTFTGNRVATLPDASFTFAGQNLANVFTLNQSISNTAPALTLTDTTASAKSLTIAVDGNFADLRESAGAAGSLLRLDLANNRVGIGATEPGSKLDIYTPSITANTNVLTLSAGTHSAVNKEQRIRFYDTRNYDLGYIGSGFDNTAGGYVAFGTLSASTLGLAPTEQMRITHGGNVGIGTASPVSKLSINGTSRGIFLDTETILGWSGLWFGANALTPTSVNYNFISNGSDASFNRPSGGSMFFREANATQMVIMPTTGNVGIGTATPRKLADFLSTSQAQLRLSYADNSVYSDFTVGSGGNLTVAPTGDFIFDPTGNDILPQTNYDLNLGSLTNKYLTLHAAELWVETLVAQNTVATIGGRIIVAPTTPISADLAAAGTTITVKYNNLANGDRIYMESNGKVEFMAVTSVAGGSAGAYTYTVTRDLDGTGANDWFAGDAVVNTGTTGNGFIDLYSVSGVIPGSTVGPTIVGNVRTGTTYNNIEPRWAIGNLNGLYGYGGSTYGAAFGSPSAAWLKIDPTNGVRIGHSATTFTQIDASGNASFSGSITAAAGSIGGFSIGADYVRDAANSFGLSSTVTAGDDVRFWAGDTFANRATAPFRLTEAGVLVATSATITGAITANTGSIGGAANGFTISAGLLTAVGTGIFQTSPTALTGIKIDSTSLRGYNGTVQTVNIATDGSGWFGLTGTRAISWTAAGVATVGGFTVNTSALYTSTKTAYNDTVVGVHFGTDGIGIGNNVFTVSAAGALVATSANITGAITASSGSITGPLTISGASGSLAFGVTPPTSASAGTGIWLDRTGMYGLASNVVQAKFDASTGAITAGAGAVVLDSVGAVQVRKTAGVDSGFLGAEADQSVTLKSIAHLTTDASAKLTLMVQTYANVPNESPNYYYNIGGLVIKATKATDTWDARWYSLALPDETFGGGDAQPGGSSENHATFSGMTVGANAAPNSMLDVRGDAIVTGLLKAGSGPTTLTDAAGKILLAALENTGAWTAYNPTITTYSGTITTLGTVTGRYKLISNKTCLFQAEIPIVTNGTGAGAVDATLPFTAAAFPFVVPGEETVLTAILLYGEISASNTKVRIRKQDGTYPGANGYTLVVSGAYEIA